MTGSRSVSRAWTPLAVLRRIVPDAAGGFRSRNASSGLEEWDLFYRCNRASAEPKPEECEGFDRQIVVAFQTEALGTGDRPPINDYVSQIRAFRDTYPEVAAYSAWNEPNHPLQPFDSSRKTTSRNEHHYGPRWAALYTHYAQRTLCFNDCAIIAADLAQGRVRDNDRVIQYLRDYRAALVRRNGPNRALPTVWGVHPYNDVRRYRPFEGRGQRALHASARSL